MTQQTQVVDTHNGEEPADLIINPRVVSVISVLKVGTDLATWFLGK